MSIHMATVIVFETKKCVSIDAFIIRKITDIRRFRISILLDSRQQLVCDPPPTEKKQQANKHTH